MTAAGAVSIGRSNVPTPPWILRESTLVGVSGAVLDGVTLAVAEGALLPTALVAITEQVTATPLVRPVTVSGDANPVVLSPPQVTVKLMIAEPPVDAGAVKVTAPRPSPGMVDPIVGAFGTVAGTTLTAADAAPLPTTFAAVTEQV